MEIFFKLSFLKDFKKLPKEIKSKIKKVCFEVFPSAKSLKDVKEFDIRAIKGFKNFYRIRLLVPRLHIKRIKELPGVFSFRITRRYRVLFYFRNGEAIFFKIGHRKEIYRHS
jgi:mRNA-degrading endonuclease RelE of RelBE toxin-antitoxin system